MGYLGPVKRGVPRGEGHLLARSGFGKDGGRRRGNRWWRDGYSGRWRGVQRRKRRGGNKIKDGSQ